MSELPNLSGDLQRIHAIITRGFDVALEHGDALASGALAGPDRSGYLDYVETLASVLHAHHEMEDRVVFPALRESFAEMPFEHLALQHREMEPQIDVLRGATVALRTGPDAAAAGRLRDALAKLDAPWPFHAEVEESHVTPERVPERLTDEQRVALAERIGEFNRAHLAPDFLVIPFLLFNLPPDQHAIFARAFPPIVTEQLVPGPWRPNWAPMKRFLLD